ncbi:MAG: hypothetical protein AVDCRST_MAG28-3812 [uncultured Rubrobacteraceae bacterium]|uniref:Uncharacterized protein n=1 Tax=uncultured Rubrobacteraceae bacterium TaxID=349277 RepID=A0A6J4R4D1_9ACTN|nr:MAG: hypothetical protein AVDCRST_MAG28-3812 [uncultured Rubrobacteraceae bacterium]
MGSLVLEEDSRAVEPSPLIRVGGHLLVWTIAVVVCYSAAL